MDNLGLTLILVAFSLLLLFVTVYEPRLNIPKIPTKKLPDFSFEEVRISHIDDGVIKWQLDSKLASIDKIDAKVDMVSAEGQIYDDEKLVVSFKAPEVVMGMDASDMTLKKAKTQFYLENRVIYLNSEVLQWYSSMKQFVGTKGVEVVSDGIRLTGHSFRVDVPIQKMTIESDAEADLELN